VLLRRILTRTSPGCVGKESGHEGKGLIHPAPGGLVQYDDARVGD
jgi:hypothetical protein